METDIYRASDTELSVVVIGGVNMDIAGTPDGILRLGDSNPGRVEMSPGGVGRNIAENLCRLGRKVFLITVLGEDAYADVIRAHSRNTGIDLRYSLTDPHGRTSTYLCLNEQGGDLHAAVADMGIIDQLTPEKLEPLLPVLNGAAMVVADANLPEETLGWIADYVTVPIAADPVSVAKAARLKPLLPKLAMIKPNLPEAEILTGIAPAGDGSLTRIADELHRAGVKRVYLSLGGQGVWADDGREGTMLPCVSGPIVNTSGCGDAFIAGAADGFLRGLGTRESARRGLAAAAICAAGTEAVSPRMSEEEIDLMLSLSL